MKLTVKQQKFIDAYEGNGTAAARAAGYKGNDKTLGQVGVENLAKPVIAEAIRNRQATERQPLIASRQDRQAFWTKVQQDPDVPILARLKASELLGKSEADFTEKVTHEGTVSIAVVDPYAVPR